MRIANVGEHKTNRRRHGHAWNISQKIPRAVIRYYAVGTSPDANEKSKIIHQIYRGNPARRSKKAPPNTPSRIHLKFRHRDGQYSRRDEAPEEALTHCDNRGEYHTHPQPHPHHNNQANVETPTETLHDTDFRSHHVTTEELDKIDQAQAKRYERALKATQRSDIDEELEEYELKQMIAYRKREAKYDDKRRLQAMGWLKSIYDPKHLHGGDGHPGQSCNSECLRDKDSYFDEHNIYAKMERYTRTICEYYRNEDSIGEPRQQPEWNFDMDAIDDGVYLHDSRGTRASCWIADEEQHIGPPLGLELFREACENREKIPFEPLFELAATSCHLGLVGTFLRAFGSILWK